MIRRTVQQAVHKGVPLFNSGDHQGCVRVYRAAAQGLLDGAAGPVSRGSAPPPPPPCLPDVPHPSCS